MITPPDPSEMICGRSWLRGDVQIGRFDAGVGPGGSDRESLQAATMHRAEAPTSDLGRRRGVRRADAARQARRRSSCARLPASLGVGRQSLLVIIECRDELEHVGGLEKEAGHRAQPRERERRIRVVSGG